MRRIFYRNIFILYIFCIPLFYAVADGAQLLRGTDIPRGNFLVHAQLPLSDTLYSFLHNKLNSFETVTFLRSGELMYTHAEHFMPKLIIGDEDNEIAHRISQEHSENNNDFAMEILMVLELSPEIMSTMSNDELALHIFNVFHRISTLTGVQYFSASRKTLREFYIYSSIVSREHIHTALPDPVFSEILPSSHFIIRQEDRSFGNNMYEVTVLANSITIQNISPMVYGIIPIAGKGDLQLQIRIFRAEEYLLFYTFTSLKAPNIFGLRERIRNSFYNRMLALYNWFTHEIALY